MDRNDGVHWMLPVKRDSDGCIYSKEEFCGLLTGGFEPQPKPWAMDPIPSSFQTAPHKSDALLRATSSSCRRASFPCLSC